MQKKYAEMERVKSIVGTLTESVTNSMKELNSLKVKMASL
jgi:hypothetical protein